MGFDELRFFNFRNLVDRELALGGAREVFLVGENGQGKTNLIEAVHLLCVGSSFRESREAALVRDPAATGGVFGRYVNGPSSSRTFSLQIAPGRRKDIQIDGKPIAERKELFAQALCICFVQQDMGFVPGRPTRGGGSTTRPSFFPTWASWTSCAATGRCCARAT